MFSRKKEIFCVIRCLTVRVLPDFYRLQQK